MAKKSRNLRLSERTWNQLDQLAGWLQVENKTRVVEVLAEKEHAKMQFSTAQQINDYLAVKFPVGSTVEVDHPDGTPQTATVTAHTTDNEAQPTCANGIMVKFSDGVFVEVPASRLA